MGRDTCEDKAQSTRLDSSCVKLRGSDSLPIGSYVSSCCISMRVKEESEKAG